MKQLTESLDGGVIGWVNASPGDHLRHKKLQYAAKLGGVPMIMLNFPYLRSMLGWSKTPSGQLVAEIGNWVLENRVAVIVSSTHAPRRLGHPLAGDVIRRAARAAVNTTRMPVILLEGTAKGSQAGWAAASGDSPHILMPAPDGAPHKGTTYTLRSVRADLGQVAVITHGPDVQPATLVDPITLDTIY